MSYTGINKEWLEEHDKQVRAEGAKAERERFGGVLTKLRTLQRHWDNNMKEEWGQSLKRDYSKGAAMAFAECIDLLIPPNEDTLREGGDHQ